MTADPLDPADLVHPVDLVEPVVTWYEDHARDLPWRDPDCSAWGVLVSEIMLQQTPVVRVLPRWREWMERWPTPADLAGASPAEVLRAWASLGYPRRALRLHDCARAVVTGHGGIVPAGEEELRRLPGIGEYTAAAVAAFAFGRRSCVIDTNIRRVQARAVTGTHLPAPSLSALERRLALALLPADAARSVRWNVGVMELGALVCTARTARCGDCPLAGVCAWHLAGHPVDPDAPARKVQGFAGTDRQARGRVLKALRESDVPLARTRLAALWPQDAQQFERALSGLLADGLVVEGQGGVSLPG